MSFEKIVDQENVLDGTALITQVHPGEGAYITILGRNEQVYIVAFDIEDLEILAEVHRDVTNPTGGAA